MHSSQVCLCWVAPEDRSCRGAHQKALSVFYRDSESGHLKHFKWGTCSSTEWFGLEGTLKFQSSKMGRDTFHYHRLLQTPSSTCQLKQTWIFHRGWVKHHREPKGFPRNSPPHYQYLSLNKVSLHPLLSPGPILLLWSSRANTDTLASQPNKLKLVNLKLACVTWTASPS